MVRILISCCGALLLSIALWSILTRDDSAPLELEAGPTKVAVQDAPSVPLDRPNATQVGREDADPEVTAEVTAAASAEPSAQDPVTVTLLSGRVRDLFGIPVAGVSVRQVGAPQLVRTDSDGRFRIDFDSKGAGHTLRVDDERWATVYECEVALGAAERDHFIVVAPAIEIAGQVVDEAGQGVSLADVSIDGLGLAASHFPLPLSGNRLAQFRTKTKADGSFVIDPAPLLSDAQPYSLAAAQQGYRGAAVSLPRMSTRDVSLVLTRTVREDAQITGIVLLPDGGPAARARVRLGMTNARAGDDGRFALPIVEYLDDGLALAAGLDEYGPAVIESFGATVNGNRPEAPPDVVLQLGPMLEIRGVLLGEDGEPASSWQVSLHDATLISRRKFPPDAAEGLGKGSSSASTDQDGRFRLHSLLPREYTLLVRNTETLQSFYSAPIEAGDTNVVLRVPPDGLYASVKGIVVDLSGLPVEHADVAVGLMLHRSEYGYAATSLDGVSTDAEGRFELSAVPKQLVHFQVSGDAVMPQHFEWQDGMDPEALVLEVALRCHFKLRVAATDVAFLRYAVLDANGGELEITTHTAGAWSSNTRCELQVGDNPVRTVSQSAQTLRIFNGQAVLHEQSIWLDPQAVTEIAVELP